jgi:acetylornithine deacetylase
MEPFELPPDAFILEVVLRQYRCVAGREPAGVGTVLPGSYTGNDTCHLWRAGVPCLLYGPGGGSESATVPDEYTRISDMHQVAQVLVLTALEVCNLSR